MSSASLHQQPKVEDAGETSFERKRTVQYSDSVNLAPEMTATTQHSGSNAGFLQHSASQTKQRKRRGTAGRSIGAMEEVLGREEAEDLMGLVQGTVVLWPYDWLEREERGGNWLYNIDQLAPLEIYD
ncbi:Phospholipase D1 [Friedmanniomyces endolithicus]|nr:Phospholipase D1 [Friedmanniomyces endolithicus]